MKNHRHQIKTPVGHEEMVISHPKISDSKKKLKMSQNIILFVQLQTRFQLSNIAQKSIKLRFGAKKGMGGDSVQDSNKYCQA